jgi:hypothetical protein
VHSPIVSIIRCEASGHTGAGFLRASPRTLHAPVAAKKSHVSSNCCCCCCCRLRVGG